MCIAVPAQVLSISGQEAELNLQGNVLSVCISLVPQVKPGDYVLVHAGFAIHIIQEQDARETLSYLKELEDFAKQ